MLDEMMKKISQYPNGTYLRLEWENEELILDGEIDTIYESNNGLDEEEEGYKEFYACAIRIKKIYNNYSGTKYSMGELIEISVENSPKLISLQNGKIIWKKMYNDINDNL